MKILHLLVLISFGVAEKPNIHSLAPAGRSDRLLQWLIEGCDRGTANTNCETPLGGHPRSEYEGYDGWYNNLGNPSLGAIDTPLLRVLPASYDDGVYQPVKRDINPFDASEQLMKGPNGQTSKIGRTAFLVFFGQQVVEEVLDAQRPACPPEYFNIPISPDHEYANLGPAMPLLRTRFDQTTGTSPNNPRQQLNEITPYLDGGLVYGIAKGWTDVLRTKGNGAVQEGGQLAHNEESEFLPEVNRQRLPEANPPPPTFHKRHEENGETENVDRFFKLGNPRGNENPFLLTFGIFWYRWHNVIAKFLRRRYDSDVTDEVVFNEARKWVIATQQAIVMYNWLPKYLGSGLEPYYSNDGRSGGYDPSVNPQVSHVFQSAAMRFGHTLVTSGVYLRDTASDGCKSEGFNFASDPESRHAGVRTCNSFFRAQELFTGGKSRNFERFLLGLSSQSTEREDNIIVDDLRGRVFGPLEFNRRDLMAINIQRGRDHGLPDYNTARKHFNLPKLTTFEPSSFKTITGSQVSDEILKRFSQLYPSVDDVDIWSGGLLETGEGPGPLFTAIIKDQFRRIRNGDRFWFENVENDLFTLGQRRRLRDLTIIDIIMSITNFTAQDIQPDPFRGIHTSNGLPAYACGSELNSYPCSLREFPKVQACHFLTPLSDANLEPCTRPETYDYFSGSVVSYILTFFFVGFLTLGLVIGVHGWSIFLRRQKLQPKGTIKIKEGCFKFKERVSRFDYRTSVASFSPAGDKIMVDTIYGKNLRTIDCGGISELNVLYTHDFRNILIRAEHHYDLFMVFDDSFNGQQFFEKFPQHVRPQVITEEVGSKAELTSQVVTVKQRERDLAKLSNYVMRYVFDQDEDDDLNRDFLLHKKAGKFYSLHLTRNELAEFFGMEADSIFLGQLFHIMDTDDSGFISLSEFLHVMLIFNKGSLEEKARMYFQIYDVDNSGYLTSDDFLSIFQSTFRKEAKQEDALAVIDNMLASIGLQSGQNISFDQFFQVLKTNKTFVATFGVDITNQLMRSESTFTLYADDVQPQKEVHESDDELHNKNISLKRDEPSSKFAEQWRQVSNTIKNKEKLIFLGCLYTLVMFWIFGERAYYYSVEREHGGLRHIAGYGVTLTRGAASAMMFTYSTILITMCRNTLSFLRSTPANQYFPFDDMVPMHKYIAWWALAWTCLHIVGHAVNFYHISTQTASDLACLFRDFYRSTHVLPKFHYWCFQTITGITGVLLTVQVAVIYIFASFARRHMFYLFWLTHNTYPLFYVLLVLHGSGNLVQPPLFHYFFLAPCILFVLDKLVSVARSTIEISVARATHLPSQVTLLHISRPPNFSFLSGQWLRLCVPSISLQESHPFTISSAPHESFLTLHIRSVGPFTNKLRKRFPDYNDIKNIKDFQYEKVQIDGPFGEGHQTWWDYEVVVFVGGGIGITPFASILKDIVHKSKEAVSTFKCKRVIFLWVTRSQKQFEWMTDILQRVEKSDLKDIIRIHIFITQFKSKLDMRSFLIYMAERHFQKVSGRSLFTGLKALTHFSRPNFAAVFSAIKARHGSVNIIGVFTCGNPSLSNSVEAGCYQENKNPGPVLKHYYENF